MFIHLICYVDLPKCYSWTCLDGQYDWNLLPIWLYVYPLLCFHCLYVSLKVVHATLRMFCYWVFSIFHYIFVDKMLMYLISVYLKIPEKKRMINQILDWEYE